MRENLSVTENELSRIIVDSAFKIHSTLGPGLFESVYEITMAHELEQRGCRIVRQLGIPVVYNQVKLNLGFRADIIVNRKVIIEIKSVESNRTGPRETASNLFTTDRYEAGITY